MGNFLVMAEPAPRMDLSRPSPLRLIGFLLVALGGLLAWVAALLTWFTVGLTNDTQNVLTQRYLGIDLLEGKVVLVAGLILLAGIVALRSVRGATARLVLAGTLILASLLTVGIAIAAATGTQRFRTRALEDMATSLKIPLDQLRRSVDQIASLHVVVTRGVGIWVALAGGIVALAGAMLSLVWALRLRDGAPTDGPSIVEPGSG